MTRQDSSRPPNRALHFLAIGLAFGYVRMLSRQQGAQSCLKSVTRPCFADPNSQHSISKFSWSHDLGLWYS
jgi:hypothetical protein